MPESAAEVYEKLRPYREKVKEFKKELEPGSDGRIVLGGRRLLFFGSEYALGDLYKEIRKIVGPPVDTLIYRVGIRGGLDAGNKMSKILEKMCTGGFDVAQTWCGGLGFYFGWGLIWIVEEKESEALIRVYNGWEAESYLDTIGKSDTPMCHFTRGFFAGAAGVLKFKSENVEGVETKCTTKGDPYCEFVVRVAKSK